MLVECPSCFVKVIPKVDNRCPSCSKSLERAGEQGVVALTITPDTLLPQRCHRCACNTPLKGEIVHWTRSEEIVDRRNEEMHWLVFGFSLISSPLLSPLLKLLKANEKPNDSEGIPQAVARSHKLRLQTCGQCDPTETKVLDHWPDRPAFRLLVHRDFASATQQRQLNTNS